MTTKFLYYKPHGAPPQLLNFDIECVFLESPVVKQGNRKLAVPYYNHNGVHIPLKFQTPQMATPFELDFPNFGDEKKYYKQFSISFRGEEENPDLLAFRDVVSSIDQRFIDLLTEHSATWLGSRGKKPKSREVIDENYTYLIKDGWSEKKQVKYPDNIVVKCNIRQQLLQAAFFDDEGNTIIDEESIRLAQNEAICIIHMSSLWIVQTGYHPKFEANQVQIFENSTLDRSFGIVNDSDEDERGAFVAT
jgi:hypothetical protein